MKKSRLFRCLRITALMICIILSVWFGNTYVCRRWAHDDLRITAFYLEPECSLDVIFMGASDVENSYSPMQAYMEQGFTSYDYSYNGSRGDIWKYILEEVLKRQDPDLICIEINGIITEDPSINNSGNMHNVTDNMPMSWNKFHLIMDIVEKPDRIGHFLPLTLYHNQYPERLSDINKNYRNINDLRQRGFACFKGYAPLTMVYAPQELHDLSQDQQSLNLLPEYEETFISFLEYCREKGIKNILFYRALQCLEVQDDFEYRCFRRTYAAEKIIRQYGYDFINLELMPEEIGLDYQKDFYNPGHLNVYGMEKTTSFLAEYIMSHYDVHTDHSAQAEAEWQHGAELYPYYIEYIRTLTDRGDGRLVYETKEVYDTIVSMQKNQ